MVLLCTYRTLYDHTSPYISEMIVEYKPKGTLISSGKFMLNIRTKRHGVIYICYILQQYYEMIDVITTWRRLTLLLSLSLKLDWKLTFPINTFNHRLSHHKKFIALCCLFSFYKTPDVLYLKLLLLSTHMCVYARVSWRFEYLKEKHLINI